MSCEIVLLRPFLIDVDINRIFFFKAAHLLCQSLLIPVLMDFVFKAKLGVGALVIGFLTCRGRTTSATAQFFLFGNLYCLYVCLKSALTKYKVHKHCIMLYRSLATCCGILQLLSFAKTNKCGPILVQGLRQDIEINFHINNIYGSVAQWISAWLWI